jgi:hypothetical protein
VRTIYAVIVKQIEIVMSLPLTNSVFDLFSIGIVLFRLHISFIPNIWGTRYIMTDYAYFSMRRATLEFNYEDAWKKIFGLYANKVDLLEALKCFKMRQSGAGINL